MGLQRTARSFLEELADVDNPAPPDFDPEQTTDEIAVAGNSGADDASVDGDDGREHYVTVGKSKLRGSNGIELGARYQGASVSRDGLGADVSDDGQDDPFGRPGEGFDSEDEGSEADGDEVEGVMDDFGSDGDDDDDDGDLDGNGPAAKTHLSDTKLSTSKEELDDDSELEDNDDSDSVEGQDSIGDDSDASSPPPEDNDALPVKNNRAALRKLMAEERKSVAFSLSAAAKADVAKGKAIKQQRSAFDSLLNTRIKLQKALIATNSIDAISYSPPATKSDSVAECESASRAAEEAAINLWNSLSSLRESLDSSSKKRPLPTTVDTPNKSLWNKALGFENNAAIRRRHILTKWSQRTNPASALQPQNRFSQAPAQPSLTSVLDRHLSGEGMERAMKRTRLARSCAPLQAASKTVVEDENIYDDADFYTMLLRELVDRRMEDSRAPSATLATHVANTLPSRAELKVKKQVDTKASKGRKMRYTVHEKLENFMVADDRGSWGERQRAELFGSLLGRKVEMKEDELEGERSEDEEAMEIDGLKLFGH